jgi:hypothetical protein
MLRYVKSERLGSTYFPGSASSACAFRHTIIRQYGTSGASRRALEYYGNGRPHLFLTKQYVLSRSRVCSHVSTAYNNRYNQYGAFSLLEMQGLPYSSGGGSALLVAAVLRTGATPHLRVHLDHRELSPKV